MRLAPPSAFGALVVLVAAQAGGRPLDPPVEPATISSVESYALSFDDRTRDAGEKARTVLTPLCPPEGPSSGERCWRVVPMATGSPILEAVPVSHEGPGREPVVAGTAWDEAYRLRRATGARRVEPLFTVDLSSWERDDLPATRSALDSPDKEAAKSDCEWSLKHIDAYRAWGMLRSKGRQEGEEGAGVLVAHPDTGYRRHPETWNSDVAKSPVFVRGGYDFLDSDEDALDELDTTGLIPTPGHGTKSGSVIASPRGKQWIGGDAGACVSGVAPGARLAPLRVSRSVVLVSQRNLARAILEAAGDDRTLLPQPAQVISISLGGLPSFALWQAVRLAQERGLIVVAAAGNYVGTVVWPARFQETIAVAATNVDCGTWTWSSHGPRVDISAPGESVWRASTEPNGSDSVGMGSGTTFATATVAGVAALWLDYHRGEAAIDALRRSGRLTEAFRRVLKGAAWRPDRTAPPRPPQVRCQAANWNPSAFGPGIVDAAGVLRAAVPALPPSRSLDAGTPDLPLFASIFPASVPDQTVRARYRRLLGATVSGAIDEVADLEGEIVLQYALDERVRATLDAMTSSRPPSSSAYSRAREALLARDLSERLRAALRGLNDTNPGRDR